MSCCDGARITTEQLPPWFQEMCPRKEAFAQTVCTVYERYRESQSGQADCRSAGIWWDDKLDAVGGILEELTGQMNTGCIILENLQESLTLALRKADYAGAGSTGHRGERRQRQTSAAGGARMQRQRHLPGNHPAGGAQDAGTANGTGG